MNTQELAALISQPPPRQIPEGLRTSLLDFAYPRFMRSIMPLTAALCGICGLLLSAYERSAAPALCLGGLAACLFWTGRLIRQHMHKPLEIIKNGVCCSGHVTFIIEEDQGNYSVTVAFPFNGAVRKSTGLVRLDLAWPKEGLERLRMKRAQGAPVTILVDPNAPASIFLLDIIADFDGLLPEAQG